MTSRCVDTDRTTIAQQINVAAIRERGECYCGVGRVDESYIHLCKWAREPAKADIAHTEVKYEISAGHVHPRRGDSAK
jgi:hypothetical protein